MFPPPVGLLYTPVILWMATGLGLLVAFRRSAPPVVLRLASVFLATWALLATTTLVWVLANGGGRGVLALLRSPSLLFDPRYAELWVAGAAGALTIFVLAFTLNQLVGRGFLNLLHPVTIAWPDRLARPLERTSLLGFDSPRAEAFSFTLLELGARWSRPWQRHEVILLSRPLLSRLSGEEIEAAVAHELGHIRGLDGRYLTFLRTFARMMRWDPMIAYLASTLTRREEYRADDEAVRLTGRPLALARALFKVSAPDTPTPMRIASAFLGGGGRHQHRDTMERIERLVRMAERTSVEAGSVE
ncbi:MAG: M48 family metallopeptidase [Thermoplasmata archaeon]